MDNSKPTTNTVGNSTSGPSSPIPNKGTKNTAPQTISSTQGVGGDQKSKATSTEVTKENKDITARTPAK